MIIIIITITITITNNNNNKNSNTNNKIINTINYNYQAKLIYFKQVLRRNNLI